MSFPLLTVTAALPAIGAIATAAVPAARRTAAKWLALAVSLEFLADQTGNAKAKVLADALDRATGAVLEQNRSPQRKVGQLDNRGSHFYLALYWAQELARQSEDAELAAAFEPLAESLAAHETAIVDELAAVQGHLAAGRLSLDGLVTHRAPAAAADAAYRTAFGDAGCLKMILDWSATR